MGKVVEDIEKKEKYAEKHVERAWNIVFGSES